MKRIKIFMTGGHLAPAEAVIDEISRRKLPWEIIFIGRTHAVEGSRERAKEQEVIEAAGIRFTGLTTGRLQRTFSLYTITSLLKIPVGFVQALILCARERPDVVVSFGGYIALPVVAASYLVGIPVLTHEQTRIPGLANKIIAVLARKVCISFPDIHHTFPKKKTIYTGLPIRKEILETQARGLSGLPVDKFPLIYITGGTIGSVTLNNLLFPILGELLDRYTIIHQTGNASYEKAVEVKQSMRDEKKERYIIQDYFDKHIVGWILRSADFVICRSGANTVMELAILGKKAILIPLPWSGGGEQLENARWLKDRGQGYIILQNTLNRGQILTGLDYLSHVPVPHMKKTADVPKDGAGRVVDEIMGLTL